MDMLCSNDSTLHKLYTVWTVCQFPDFLIWIVCEELYLYLYL